MGNSENLKWDVPYLPLDPQDIGRTYEAIIRVNSQSGKGGSAWVILRNLELDLPRGLQVDFSRVVQISAESKGRELTNSELCDLFKQNYCILYDEEESTDFEKEIANGYPYKLIDYSLTSFNKSQRSLKVELDVNGETKEINGTGNGPISAFIAAIKNDLG